MSKCLTLNTMTVTFKDKTILQISAIEIKHSCINDKHVVEAKFESQFFNYEEVRTFIFNDKDVEEIVQSWHERTTKEAQ